MNPLGYFFAIIYTVFFLWFCSTIKSFVYSKVYYQGVHRQIPGDNSSIALSYGYYVNDTDYQPILSNSINLISSDEHRIGNESELNGHSLMSSTTDNSYTNVKKKVRMSIRSSPKSPSSSQNVFIMPEIDTTRNYSQVILEQKQHHYKLVVATTLIDTDESRKRQIQKTAIYNWVLQHDDILLVVFTKNETWIQFCQDLYIPYYSEMKLNFYKSIYLSGMISVIEHNYESDFYGYVNGDILLSHNVYEVLTTIEKNIRMNRLLPDVFIIGKRFNLDHNHNITIVPEKDAYSSFIHRSVFLTPHHIPLAIDLFIFPASTMPLSEFPSVIVGRNGIDAVLLDYNHHRHVDMIDISYALEVLHLNDHFGAFAGNAKKHSDNHWNRQKYGHKVIYESARVCNKELYRLEDHSYCLYNQLDYDDSYSDKEMKFLAKFITPDDTVFSYNHGYSKGTLGQLSKYAVQTHYDTWFMSIFKENKTEPNSMNIANSFYIKGLGNCGSYRSYINRLFDKNVNKYHYFDVYVLNMSPCPIHILQHIQNLHAYKYVIIRGTNTYVFKEIMPIINEYFNLIDRYVPKYPDCLEISVFKPIKGKSISDYILPY